MRHPLGQPGPPHLDRALMKISGANSFGKTNHGQRFPQAIAHRGYKAAYPENTMGAFAGAISIGAHAIETDLHITKDKVVVLSHDATLKRCFGRPERLVDVDWDYVSRLETIKEPKQHMPRLRDLLEFLALPANEDIWLVLDIKVSSQPSLPWLSLARPPPSKITQN